MSEQARPHRNRLAVLATTGIYAAGTVFLIMIPFSFLGYTSFGFDYEYEQGQNVVEEFYRARWPGDGSFRIGGGTIFYALEEEDVDAVDLAGRFLEPPTSELTRTSWLRLNVATGVPEGDKGRLKSSTWLILPSLLPGLILPFYLLMRTRWQNSTTTPP